MAIRCIKTCTKWNIHVATIAIRYHRTGAGNLFPLHAEAPLDKPLSAGYEDKKAEIPYRCHGKRRAISISKPCCADIHLETLEFLPLVGLSRLSQA